MNPMVALARLHESVEFFSVDASSHLLRFSALDMSRKSSAADYRAVHIFVLSSLAIARILPRRARLLLFTCKWQMRAELS